MKRIGPQAGAFLTGFIGTLRYAGIIVGSLSKGLTAGADPVGEFISFCQATAEATKDTMGTVGNDRPT